jgi:hypothetical protein
MLRHFGNLQWSCLPKLTTRDFLTQEDESFFTITPCRHSSTRTILNVRYWTIILEIFTPPERERERERARERERKRERERERKRERERERERARGRWRARETRDGGAGSGEQGDARSIAHYNSHYSWSEK